MDQESHSFSSSKTSKIIQVNLDEFQISEDTFKPMTKGLGFHHDVKRPSFKPAPKEVKVFGSSKSPMTSNLSSLPSTLTTNITKTENHLPTGLEAFYGAKPASKTEAANLFEQSVKEEIKTGHTTLGKAAPQTTQFLAWAIDILVIASFVVLTAVLLVFASGIEFNMYSRLISIQDLTLFGAAIFSIYYLLYFTILDLSASPGKTIFGIRLARVDGKEVSVKHTFTRALISLLSGVALFLPMLLDFQGRLSDTKVVK